MPGYWYIMQKREIGDLHLRYLLGKIEEWRDREGISEPELANRVGVSQPAVSRVLTGERPNSQILEKLCQISGIDILKKDPLCSPNLAAALDAVWDGTEHRAKALATLLMAADQLSVR
jgi:transcriptional regulator with XRE-family HTH domain